MNNKTKTKTPVAYADACPTIEILPEYTRLNTQTLPTQIMQASGLKRREMIIYVCLWIAIRHGFRSQYSPCLCLGNPLVIC